MKDDKYDILGDLSIIKCVAKSGSRAGQIIEFWTVDKDKQFNPLNVAKAKEMGIKFIDLTSPRQPTV